MADRSQTQESARVREVAERLFAQAVSQGMNAPFALDCEYWGRQYATKLLDELAEDCPTCEGDGEVAVGFDLFSGNRPRIETCPECGGTGKEASNG